MPVPQDLQTTLDAIDADTNSLADVVASLRAKISTSMTQADVDLVKGKLDSVHSRLKGIAADPAQPVPTEPAPTPFPNP